MPPKKLSLESLLAPVSAEEFFASHWEKTPLHVRRGSAELYSSLLTPSNLDELVSAACRSPETTVEALGDPEAEDPRAVSRLESADGVHRAYARGATFRILGAHKIHAPLLSLARHLEQTFGCPVAVNLYATPPGAQGARLHYDNHDVLVLQVSGRKTWRVYEPLRRLPLAHVPPLPFEERGEELKYARGGPGKGRGDIADNECGEPLHEFNLVTGDLLYLPRGFVHEARTDGEASVHLTCGLHVLTWLDLLTVATGQLAQRDERLRAALPPGLLHDTNLAESARAQFDALLEALARGANLRDALSEVAESFVRSRRAADEGGGAPASEGGSAEVGAATLLERRPGLLCRLVDAGEGVGLASAQGVLWMPKAFRTALGFVARREEFRVEEIPGGLSEAGRLALARRLIQDGFVRVARELQRENY